MPEKMPTTSEPDATLTTLFVKTKCFRALVRIGFHRVCVVPTASQWN